MPTIAYIEKNFRQKTLATIGTANAIIEEYRADGMILTLRQLYYQFVARGYIPNNKREYSRLGDIIGDARLAGYIDWDSIEDRTRDLKSRPNWSNPGDILSSARASFHLDYWEGQETRPEVWIEKQALIGVIEDVCRRLDVSYYACIGYVSLSEMWRASERFAEMDGEGQTPVIIHLGDHDPSGIDMTRDIEDRQNVFSYMGGIDVVRIALNMNQIEQYSPPPNFAKLSDSRASDYIRMYGSSSWELDALEPTVLRDLIERRVLSYRDDSIYEEVVQRENQYIRTLRNIEDNWETL